MANVLKASLCWSVQENTAVTSLVQECTKFTLTLSQYLHVLIICLLRLISWQHISLNSSTSKTFQISLFSKQRCVHRDGLAFANNYIDRRLFLLCWQGMKSMAAGKVGNQSKINNNTKYVWFVANELKLAVWLVHDLFMWCSSDQTHFQYLFFSFTIM